MWNRDNCSGDMINYENALYNENLEHALILSSRVQKVDPEIVFTKQERIGKGSFGEVFKGIDNRTQQVKSQFFHHFWMIKTEQIMIWWLSSQPGKDHMI